LTLHKFLLPLKSCFRIAYLDDITLGGSVPSLLHDINSIKDAEIIGLHLNARKSEIIADGPSSNRELSDLLPGASLIDVSSAYLLGSPLGNVECIGSAISCKVDALRCLGD
jgi:hypothetical protein